MKKSNNKIGDLKIWNFKKLIEKLIKKRRNLEKNEEDIFSFSILITPGAHNCFIDGKPVLCTAISQGNINNLLRCFRDNHNSLDRDPIQGKNAYHYATTQCNHDLFNIFIDNEKVTHGSRGVSLRMLSTCYKNLTPLHWAVIASNLEAFERILTEIWSYSEIVEKIFSMEYFILTIKFELSNTSSNISLYLRSRISRMNILHLIVDSSSEPLFMKCSFEILRCHKMLHLVEVPWGKFGNSIIHQSVLLNQTSMLGIMVQEVENLMCLNALKETPLVTAAINDCSKSFVVLIDALISREITHSKKPNFVKIRDLASCRCRRKKTFHVGSKGSFSCAQVSKMIESKICDRLDVIKSL